MGVRGSCWTGSWSVDIHKIIVSTYLHLFATVQVYLVVGGYIGSALGTDTTEVFSGGRWRTVGALPEALNGLAGVTIENIVFMTGLYQTFVLHVLQM